MMCANLPLPEGAVLFREIMSYVIAFTLPTLFIFCVGALMWIAISDLSTIKNK